MRRSRLWESTNLSLREDGEETFGDVVVGTPRPKNQQQAHSEKGTRLNEHGDDGFGRFTDPTYPHGRTNAPGVQDESDDDHEGEDDVE